MNTQYICHASISYIFLNVINSQIYDNIVIMNFSRENPEHFPFTHLLLLFPTKKRKHPKKNIQTPHQLVQFYFFFSFKAFSLANRRVVGKQRGKQKTPFCSGNWSILSIAFCKLLFYYCHRNHHHHPRRRVQYVVYSWQRQNAADNFSFLSVNTLVLE